MIKIGMDMVDDKVTMVTPELLTSKDLKGIFFSFGQSSSLTTESATEPPPFEMLLMECPLLLCLQFYPICKKMKPETVK